MTRSRYHLAPRWIIKHALCDAILNLSALHEGGGGTDFTRELEEDYRRMLKLRYGMDRTPEEEVGGQVVSVDMRELLG